MAERGRTTGYRLTFKSPDTDALVASGQGLWDIGTSVELFNDSEAASSYIDQVGADFERFVGTTIDIQPTSSRAMCLETTDACGNFASTLPD